MSGFKNNEESMYETSGICAYPSCRAKRIFPLDPVVIWDGMCVNRRMFENQLSPMAKLAVIANPTKSMEVSGAYSVQLDLHPECAAEWGMQLIKDALKIKPSVGQTLRNSVKEPRNDLQEHPEAV